MAKEKRSNKWAFLLYQESAPEHYLDVLENMHIPCSQPMARQRHQQGNGRI